MLSFGEHGCLPLIVPDRAELLWEIERVYVRLKSIANFSKKKIAPENCLLEAQQQCSKTENEHFKKRCVQTSTASIQ